MQNCDEVEIIADYGANVTDSEPASVDNSGAGTSYESTVKLFPENLEDFDLLLNVT